MIYGLLCSVIGANCVCSAMIPSCNRRILNERDVACCVCCPVERVGIASMLAGRAAVAAAAVTIVRVAVAAAATAAVIRAIIAAPMTRQPKIWQTISSACACERTGSKAQFLIAVCSAHPLSRVGSGDKNRSGAPCSKANA